MGFFKNLLRPRPRDVGELLRAKYASFRRLLAANNEVLELMTELEAAVAGGRGVPAGELRDSVGAVHSRVAQMVQDLNVIAEGRYRGLLGSLESVAASVDDALREVRGTSVTATCIPIEGVSRDLADAVGGKTGNLGEAKNRAGLPVPPGFAVTAFAYRAFVESAGLQGRLSELWDQIDWADMRRLSRVADAMQELIVAAELPQDVREAITMAAHDLYRKAPGRPRISIRSSAIGEDSHASFAGQYSTFLNVPLEQVLRRYKETVASKFSPRALFYMHSKGFREDEIAMSVGCFLMVDAAAAGVAYSADPATAGEGALMISGVWGLGKPVVDGSVTPDTFLVPRREGGGAIRTLVVRKARRLVAAPHEGVEEEEVPAELQERPCLDPEQVLRLASYVRTLEAHFRGPQDVEWALDRQGRLFILQTRPLGLAGRQAPPRVLDEEALTGYPLLLAGGSTACPGVGAGAVVPASSDEDLSTFPHGGVLVARQNSPRFVEVMTRAAAILTEIGSASGHMACLAREYGVPTITGVVGAASLSPGAIVTVDANRCRVYGGRIEPLLATAISPSAGQRDRPSQALAERVCARIAHLNLTNAAKNSFRAKNCRTYHDLIRFCHEMAISEMFRVNDYHLLRERGVAFRLDCDVPLGIYLIDLGGGVTASPGARSVKPGAIASIPMRALWSGMVTPGVRWAGARPLDARGFLSVWANTLVDVGRAERGLGDDSYAMVGSHYLSFGSRLGYHFTTLESVCSDSLHENYISFRFKGGAADLERRERRVRFIAEVLSTHDFTVDHQRDLLNAWVRKLPREETEARLAMLGRLMACARQLDVTMHAETTVASCIEAFLSGDYAFFDFPNGVSRHG